MKNCRLELKNLIEFYGGNFLVKAVIYQNKVIHMIKSSIYGRSK